MHERETDFILLQLLYQQITLDWVSVPLHIDYDAMNTKVEAKSTSLPFISSGSELAMGHDRPFVSLLFNPMTWPYPPSVSFQSIKSSQSLSDNASPLSSPTLPQGSYSFTSISVDLVKISSVVCCAQSAASLTDNRSAPSTPVHVHSSSTLNVQANIPPTHASKYLPEYNYEFDSGTLTHCHTSMKSICLHELLPWLTQACILFLGILNTVSARKILFIQQHILQNEQCLISSDPIEINWTLAYRELWMRHCYCCYLDFSTLCHDASKNMFHTWLNMKSTAPKSTYCLDHAQFAPQPTFTFKSS